MPDKDLNSSTNVLFEVWLTARATTAAIDTALAATGLTADEFAVYSVLRTGSPTPTELAEWMSAPPTTVSSYIKRLEARGHVLRTTHPSDKRSYRLALTAAGERAYRDAGTRFLPVLASVEANLGDATPSVHRALTALSDAVKDALRVRAAAADDE